MAPPNTLTIFTMAGLVEDLPWGSMSPKALEELTFAIVEEMGAVELKWRSSDESINSPDAGRDIEAIFNRPTPDGDIERQQWWLECKRRNRVVSPSDVKEGVLNAVAYTEISYYIIVTNSHFSNPTQDWITRHNERHSGPIVKLWDRKRLQGLVSKYPSAAAKSLVAALSFPERIEYLASYFFEHGRTLNEVELRLAWERREEIDSAEFCIAASYADICTGNIDNRPWMTCLSNAQLFSALVLSYTALIGTIIRDLPVVNENVVETVGYITGCAAHRLPDDRVQAVLADPPSFLADPFQLNDGARDLIVEPGKRSLANELLLRCADDCARYSISLSNDDPLTAFWSRYGPQRAGRDSSHLAIINTSIRCAVGLEVTSDILCPLDSVYYLRDNKRYIDMVKRVIDFRIRHPNDQYLLYSRTNNSCAESPVDEEDITW